ncbi:MAG: leucine-rich repeat domain-containing protein [Gemmatimonadetes bacterium]|nr:MAG: leucine-rich repeat domain-containing protein [Gemmatimonadota bacterium]
MTREELLNIIQYAKEHRLTELDLSDRGITELPPEIGELTHLEILNLRRNRLRTLPKEIKELVHLQELNLGSNQFQRRPYLLEQMPNLKVVWFDNNPGSE